MRWIGATVIPLVFASAAIADVYRVERIEDHSMSCPDLVAEIGRVEDEINEADEAKTQAKRAMDWVRSEVL